MEINIKSATAYIDLTTKKVESVLLTEGTVVVVAAPMGLLKKEDKPYFLGNAPVVLLGYNQNKLLSKGDYLRVYTEDQVTQMVFNAAVVFAIKMVDSARIEGESVVMDSLVSMVGSIPVMEKFGYAMDKLMEDGGNGDWSTAEVPSMSDEATKMAKKEFEEFDEKLKGVNSLEDLVDLTKKALGSRRGAPSESCSWPAGGYRPDSGTSSLARRPRSRRPRR